MNEAAAKYTAWLEAKRQGAYMVVIHRGDALVNFPLTELRIMRGDTVIALVSPHSQPTQPEA
ncbi:MAG: hypothetical protein H6661_10230 [Ardenticatenaceae bacterium]|nr:hypothetical protein [Ardenticatenaceae bacterium]